MQCDTNKTPQAYASLSLNLDDSNEFIALVTNAIATGNKSIHINCSQFKNITSSRVGLLWEVHLLCKESKVKLVLDNVSKSIQSVFKTLDLFEIFTIQQSNEVVPQIEKKEINIIHSRTIPKLTKQFIPTSENIMHLKFQIHQHLHDSFFSEQFIYEIETIFYEVATNIRLHAKLKNLDMVEFYLLQEKNNIKMTFIDNGISFNITENRNSFDPVQSIKRKKRNGLGIHMMHKMTDRISYQRKDDKNILEFTKAWREQND